MISIGASEQNCSLRQKSRLALFDFALRGGLISVTEYTKAKSPFVQRCGALACHPVVIKRAPL
jgi:hypothetical protein